MTVPRRVGTDKFVDCSPTAFVVCRRSGVGWRFGNDLAPEETRDVPVSSAGNVTVRDIQIGITIMIKVPCVGRPRPAPHLDTGLYRNVLECAVSLIPVQGIALHVTVIKSTKTFWLTRMKLRVLKHAHTRRDPHSSRVDILYAAIVDIEPTGAHTRARFVDVSLAGNRSKRPVAVVAIEVVSPEVVYDVQIRPAVSIAVSPRTRKAVAVVLNIQTSGLSAVFECAVSFVVEEIVRRAVSRIEIWHRISVLTQALVVVVQAEINVEAPIVVVIGNRSMRERALRRTRKTECISPQREFPVALV